MVSQLPADGPDETEPADGGGGGESSRVAAVVAGRGPATPRRGEAMKRGSRATEGVACPA